MPRQTDRSRENMERERGSVSEEEEEAAVVGDNTVVAQHQALFTGLAACGGHFS